MFTGIGRRDFLKLAAGTGAAHVLGKLAGAQEPPVYDIAAEVHSLVYDGATKLSETADNKYNQILTAYNDYNDSFAALGKKHSKANKSSTDYFKFINAIAEINNRAVFSDEDARNITGKLIMEGAHEGPTKGALLIAEVVARSNAGHDLHFILGDNVDKKLSLDEMLAKGLPVIESHTAARSYQIASWPPEVVRTLKDLIAAERKMRRAF
jgi:hypothetical protein